MRSTSVLSLILSAFLAAPAWALVSVPPEQESPTAIDTLLKSFGSVEPPEVPELSGAPVERDRDEDQQDAAPDSLFDACGPFGVICPSDPGVEPMDAPRPAPPIRGFGDLGPKGSKGKIDGPGSAGNGSYSVIDRGDHILSLWLDTGYMKMTLTLKRDPDTGADTITVIGKILEDGAWKEVDDTGPVRIDYDAGDDEGTITWTQDGQKKSEGFWSGEDGDRVMVIEFGGGWNHEFERSRD